MISSPGTYPEPKPAKIESVEIVYLSDGNETAEHNLKKMRTAMTMLTSAVTDAESDDARKKSEERFKEIDKKFAGLNLGDKQSNTRRAVESGLQLCRGIFNPVQVHISLKRVDINSEMSENFGVDINGFLPFSTMELSM